MNNTSDVWNENRKKTERESGIELLRIICIWFIFLMHEIGGIEGAMLNYKYPVIWKGLLCIINALCNTDITVFVLISGYFGIKYSGKRLIKFHNVLMFWGITLVLVNCLTGNGDIYLGADGTKELASRLFPVLSGGKWSFPCHYFWLNVFAPYINEIIERFSREWHKRIIFIMFFAFSFLPTFCYFEIFEDAGKGFPYMVFVYFVGRYLGKYHKDVKFNSIQLLSILGMTFAAIVSLNIVVSYAMHSARFYFNRDLSSLIFLESIALFYLFKKMKFHSKTVNSISKASLGALMAEWVTGRFFEFSYIYDYLESALFLPLLLMSITLRTMLSYLFEWIRIHALGKIDDFITNIQLIIFVKIKSIVKSKFFELI